MEVNQNESKIMCDNCDCEIIVDENDSDDSCLCDSCYSKDHDEFCCVCESYYESPSNAKETYFFVSKEIQENSGLKMGIYQGVEYPIYSSSVLGDDVSIFEDNVNLLSETDINEIYKKKYDYEENVIEGAEFICKCCANEYSKK
jgi:hypothetical protein